jgi:hypothetical protein
MIPGFLIRKNNICIRIWTSLQGAAVEIFSDTQEQVPCFFSGLSASDARSIFQI